MRETIAVRRHRFREAAALYLLDTGTTPSLRVLRLMWRLSLEP